MEKISKTLKELEIGKIKSYPIGKLSVVRATANRIQKERGVKFKTHTSKDEIYIEKVN